MDQEPVLNQEEAAGKEEFSQRLESAKCACSGALARLKNDLKEAGANPYIRATSTVRYEILRSKDDEEPVDTFEIRKTNGCSLRTLALAATLFAAVEILSIRAKIKKASKKTNKK